MPFEQRASKYVSSYLVEISDTCLAYGAKQKQRKRNALPLLFEREYRLSYRYNIPIEICVYFDMANNASTALGYDTDVGIYGNTQTFQMFLGLFVGQNLDYSQFSSDRCKY